MLVVGGGLAGTSLAYYLARQGVEVVLVERGELNREASGTNAGSFHFQIAIHQLTGTRDRQRARAAARPRCASTPRRPRCGRRWSRSSAARLDLHITGGLMVAETEEELRLLHDKSVIEEEAGLDVTVLEGEELRVVRAVPRRGSRSARRSARRRGTPTRLGRRRSSRCVRRRRAR